MSAQLDPQLQVKKTIGIRALRNALNTLLNASRHEDWTEFDLKRKEHYRDCERARLNIQLTSCRERLEAFNRGARPAPGSRPIGHTVAYVCDALSVSTDLGAEVHAAYRAKWAAMDARRLAERRYDRLSKKADQAHALTVANELYRGYRSSADLRWHYESVLIALADDDDADLDDEHPTFVFRMEPRV